jgi:PIN domain nuclease of toxin-antitoxin system
LLLDISPLDADLAYRTGELHRRTRPNGLSLADCACLSLAKLHGLPAVTADRAWAGVELDQEIVLVR